MSSPDAHSLASAGGWTQSFTKPRVILWTGVWLLIVIAWGYLGAMVMSLAPQTEFAELGPGMGLFAFIDEWLALDPLTRDLLRTLCGPAAGLSGIDGIPGWSAADFVFVTAMWSAMIVAMMLPTATPMISAYAEIGDTARAKGIEIVPTGILIAGYLAVWLAFCVLAVTGQWLLSEAVLMSPGFTLIHRGAAAAILILAGLYQFTPLKDGCLAKCRTPLPFFLANWSNEVKGVLRMGAKQGLVCVACCWALMAVMFSAGLMNILWMAALAIVMALEKVLPHPKFLVRATGVVLILLGLVELVPTVVL